MNNIEATRAALEVTQPQDRVWLLNLASRRVSTIGLGSFCAQVGANTDELGQLLLHRANTTKAT